MGLQQRGRSCGAAVTVIVLLACSGCAGDAAQLRRAKEGLLSARATIEAVTDAWLSGNVSTTYACTALEQTYLLIESERASLAGSPEGLSTERAMLIETDAEALARAVVMVRQAVRSGDEHAVRQHVAAIMGGEAHP